MPFMFNGCGTAYYGRRDVGSDGSYLTTLWITLIWVPLLPLRTYRVLPTGKGFNALVFANSEYLSQKAPFNWIQVRNVYLFALPVLVVVGYFASGDLRKEHKASNALKNITTTEAVVADPSTACGAIIKLHEDGMTRLGIKEKMGTISNKVALTESDRKAIDDPDQEVFERYALGFLTWQKPLTEMNAKLEKSFADMESKAREDSRGHPQAYADALETFAEKERSMITEGFISGRKDARLSPCPY